MNNKSLVVAKINLRNIKIACIITAVTFFAVMAQDIVMFILYNNGVATGQGQGILGIGNLLYLLIILSAIFIPSKNFNKIMNLGSKRTDFFTGCAVAYVIIAAAVSLAGILLFYTYDRFHISYYNGWTLNVLFWFGWIDNGPIIAFLQQFAFLLLFASFVHTLTAAQDKWYGWLADIAVVAIISVFTPIAVLRSALAWFFNLIIFSNPPVQIFACLALSAVIYSINKPILARKAI